MDKNEAWLLWKCPTKESAIDELEKRITDCNTFISRVTKKIGAPVSNGVQAELENIKIIKKDLKRLNSGDDPEIIMSKYHDYKNAVEAV